MLTSAACTWPGVGDGPKREPYASFSTPLSGDIQWLSAADSGLASTIATRSARSSLIKVASKAVTVVAPAPGRSEMTATTVLAPGLDAAMASSSIRMYASRPARPVSAEGSGVLSRAASRRARAGAEAIEIPPLPSSAASAASAGEGGERTSTAPRNRPHSPRVRLPSIGASPCGASFQPAPSPTPSQAWRRPDMRSSTRLSRGTSMVWRPDGLSTLTVSRRLPAALIARRGRSCSC